MKEIKFIAFSVFVFYTLLFTFRADLGQIYSHNTFLNLENKAQNDSQR